MTSPIALLLLVKTKTLSASILNKVDFKYAHSWTSIALTIDVLVQFYSMYGTVDYCRTVGTEDDLGGTWRPCWPWADVSVNKLSM